jgi:hypothetical protein
MEGHINVKSPNNISKWQMGYNLAFKGLFQHVISVEFSVRIVVRLYSCTVVQLAKLEQFDVANGLTEKQLLTACKIIQKTCTAT